MGTISRSEDLRQGSSLTRFQVRVFVTSRTEAFKHFASLGAYPEKGSNIDVDNYTTTDYYHDTPFHPWTEITDKVTKWSCTDSFERNEPEASLEGINYDSSELGRELGILIKARFYPHYSDEWTLGQNTFSGTFGSTSGSLGWSPWSDQYFGWIVTSEMTVDWQTNRWKVNLRSEMYRLENSMPPAHTFGPDNVAAGKAVKASSTLSSPILEAASGDYVGTPDFKPENVVDEDHQTLWVSENYVQPATVDYATFGSGIEGIRRADLGMSRDGELTSFRLGLGPFCNGPAWKGPTELNANEGTYPALFNPTIAQYGCGYLLSQVCPRGPVNYHPIYSQWFVVWVGPNEFPNGFMGTFSITFHRKSYELAANSFSQKVVMTLADFGIQRKDLKSNQYIVFCYDKNTFDEMIKVYDGTLVVEWGVKFPYLYLYPENDGVRLMTGAKWIDSDAYWKWNDPYNINNNDLASPPSWKGWSTWREPGSSEIVPNTYTYEGDETTARGTNQMCYWGAYNDANTRYPNIFRMRRNWADGEVWSGVTRPPGVQDGQYIWEIGFYGWLWRSYGLDSRIQAAPLRPLPPGHVYHSKVPDFLEPSSGTDPNANLVLSPICRKPFLGVQPQGPAWWMELDAPLFDQIRTENHEWWSVDLGRDIDLRLAADLGASDTSLTFTGDPSFLPLTYGEVLVEYEAMRYAYRTGTQLVGLTRGIDYSTATTHVNGRSVLGWVKDQNTPFGRGIDVPKLSALGWVRRLGGSYPSDFDVYISERPAPIYPPGTDNPNSNAKWFNTWTHVASARTHPVRNPGEWEMYFNVPSYARHVLIQIFRMSAPDGSHTHRGRLNEFYAYRDPQGGGGARDPALAPDFRYATIYAIVRHLLRVDYGFPLGLIHVADSPPHGLGHITLNSDTYRSVINDLAQRTGFRFWADRWNHLHFEPHPILRPGPILPAPTFEWQGKHFFKLFPQQPPPNQVGQIVMKTTKVDQQKQRKVQEQVVLYPDTKLQFGEKKQIPELVVGDDALAKRIAKLQFFQLNYGWRAKMQTLLGEWIQPGQRHLITYPFDAHDAATFAQKNFFVIATSFTVTFGAQQRWTTEVDFEQYKVLDAGLQDLAIQYPGGKEPVPPVDHPE